MTITLLQNKMTRREKLVIMAEIVGIAQKGASKTHIMFRANLSFTQLNLYLPFLSHKGLLEKSLNDERVVYKTTKKGLDFSLKLREVMDLINGDVPPAGERDRFAFY
jgi:predicted transcriptional regulator